MTTRSLLEPILELKKHPPYKPRAGVFLGELRWRLGLEWDQLGVIGEELFVCETIAQLSGGKVNLNRTETALIMQG
jgi:hypothetical protein